MNEVLPIIDWYQKNRRDLPWRNTQNPYLIWLSEVILQQTRVEQGLPYYLKFTERYPTVADLAEAKDDDVMKLWQGLGYYNRARNMLATARLVHTTHGGQFPTTYDDLIKLKGIGPYTAAAIASFAFNEAKAVVDGNVYRVLARFFDIAEPINSTKGKELFASLAEASLNTSFPALHNQAIMELGATVCKPSSPLCGECTLRSACMAYQQQTIPMRPVKLKKQKPKERHLHFFFVVQQGRTYIRKRSAERIWHNLYEPPYIEIQAAASPEEIRIHPSLPSYLTVPIKRADPVFQTKHQLTHQTIYATFWKVILPASVRVNDPELINIPLSELSDYAVHRLFDKFLDFYTLQGTE